MTFHRYFHNRATRQSLWELPKTGVIVNDKRSAIIDSSNSSIIPVVRASPGDAYDANRITGRSLDDINDHYGNDVDKRNGREQSKQEELNRILQRVNLLPETSERPKIQTQVKNSESQQSSSRFDLSDTKSSSTLLGISDNVTEKGAKRYVNEDNGLGYIAAKSGDSDRDSDRDSDPPLRWVMYHDAKSLRFYWHNRCMRQHNGRNHNRRFGCFLIIIFKC